MDNIVWVIIAAAVTIALGGILLYAGSGTLGDVTDSATEILNTNPEDTQVTDEDESQGSDGNLNPNTGGSDDSSGEQDCPPIGCPGIQ